MNLTGFVTSLLTPIVKVWKKGAKNGKLNGYIILYFECL